MSKIHGCQAARPEIIINPYKKFNGALVPDWLMEWECISVGAKLVYAKLCQCAGKNGKAYPSQVWLAKKLAMTRESVCKHIALLKNLGLITTEIRGTRRALAYLFLYHERMGELPTSAFVNPAVKNHHSTCEKNSLPCEKNSYRKESLKESKKNLSSLKGDSESPNTDPSPPSSQTASFSSDSKKEKSPLAGVQTPDLNIPSRWPRVAATGFGQSQVEQLCRVLVERLRLTIPDLAERLISSLSHAEALLEKGPLIDRYGNLVGNPKGYIFSALVDDGHFDPPAGWLSPEQLEAQEQERKRQEESRLHEHEIAETEKMAREKNETAFETWFDSLTNEELSELNSLKAENPRNQLFKSLKIWLRIYYWPKEVGKNRDNVHA